MCSNCKPKKIHTKYDKICVCEKNLNENYPRKRNLELNDLVFPDLSGLIYAHLSVFLSPKWEIDATVNF